MSKKRKPKDQTKETTCQSVDKTLSIAATRTNKVTNDTNEEDDNNKDVAKNVDNVNRSYAFIDSGTNKPFMYITPETTNTDLAKTYYEQQKRIKKNLDHLVLCEITNTVHANVNSTKNNNELFGNHLTNFNINESTVTIRKMNSKEPAPLHANTVFYREYLSHGAQRRNVAKHKLDSRDNPFVKPDQKALEATYSALKSLLGEDCEAFESVQVANSYYQYWRPEKVKVIILAESHVSTSKSFSCHGPIFDKRLLGVNEDGNHMYSGPVNFCSLVYCLGYGENDALIVDENTNATIPKEQNPGTWQFWNLFSACVSNPNEPKDDNIDVTSQAEYGKGVLKSSTKDLAQRINNKYAILTQMKEKGIWLIDTSIVGWYIQQPTAFDIACRSKLVTKLPNLKPRPHLKSSCLRISWEGFVKNLVREAAEGGELKLFIPIGKDVQTCLGKDSFLHAVSVEGIEQVEVIDPFPAPNARLVGGYTPVLNDIAQRVYNATKSV